MGKRLIIEYQIRILPERDLGKEGLCFTSGRFDVPLVGFNPFSLALAVKEDVSSILALINKEEEK